VPAPLRERVDAEIAVTGTGLAVAGVSELDTGNPGDVIEWLADGALQIRAVEGLSAERGPAIRSEVPTSLEAESEQ
jgi:hypothetical protein